MTNIKLRHGSTGKVARAISALALCTSVGFANSATVFSDDFESYVSGSNLIGQGGWVGTLEPTLVLSSGPLPTNVLDGLTAQPGSFFGTVRHELTGLPSTAYTLSFDAYASSSSHNTWGGLSNLSDGSGVALSMSALWEVDQGTTSGGWTFRLRDSYVPFSTFSVPGGLNQVVHLSISVDPVSMEVFGTYDFGTGPSETPHFASPLSVVEALNAVNFGFDYRGTVGMQFDSVLVSSVPEPASHLLLLLGIPIILRIQYKRVQRQA